jgi:formiminotetrahydrofolate cyclodeaminase
MPTDLSLNEYLNQIAASAITPGSVSAIVGALGFSLLSSACAQLIARKKYGENESELMRIWAQSEAFREELRKMASADIYASRDLKNLREIVKTSVKENDRQSSLIDLASITTVAVPVAVAQNCRQGMDLCQRLAKKADGDMSLDVGIGLSLCEAAFGNAICCAQANLKLVDDVSVTRDLGNLIAEIAAGLSDFHYRLFSKITNTVSQKVASFHHTTPPKLGDFIHK